jgi:hypothetical protein
MTDQPFLGPDGKPCPRLPAEATDNFRIRADGFNAARLLMAMLDSDIAEIDRILHGFPAVPLLSGVAGIALVLGEMLAGDDSARFRRVLDLLSLSPELDWAGTADTYRARMMP